MDWVETNDVQGQRWWIGNGMARQCLVAILGLIVQDGMEKGPPPLPRPTAHGTEAGPTGAAAAALGDGDGDGVWYGTRPQHAGALANVALPSAGEGLTPDWVAAEEATVAHLRDAYLTYNRPVIIGPGLLDSWPVQDNPRRSNNPNLRKGTYGGWDVVRDGTSLGLC